MTSIWAAGGLKWKRLLSSSSYIPFSRDERFFLHSSDVWVRVISCPPFGTWKEKFYNDICNFIAPQIYFSWKDSLGKRLILLERQECITARTKTVVEASVQFHCRKKLENVNICRRLTVEKWGWSRSKYSLQTWLVVNSSLHWNEVTLWLAWWRHDWLDDVMIGLMTLWLALWSH